MLDQVRPLKPATPEEVLAAVAEVVVAYIP